MATLTKKVKVASNPHRKGKTSMKNKTTNPKKRKAKKNPQTRSKKRRRNPNGIAAIIGSPKAAIEMGVAGLASAVATRQIPQLLFAADNTGILGYGMNAVTTGLVTWLAGSFIGPDAAKGALVGGLVIILDRVLTEQVSPIGQYLALSGVGDATAATKLGTIRDGFYLRPTVLDANGNAIIPSQVSDAAVAAMLARYPQIGAPPVVNRGQGGMSSRGGNMQGVRASAGTTVSRFNRNRFA
jgi:hypothetical protein